MRFFKKIISKRLNLRKEERTVVQSLLPCRVFRSHYENAFSVHVLDLSPSGMSFTVKNGNFEIGDVLRILFEPRNGCGVIHEGEVLAQQIFYAGANEDLKHAVFRYSLRFKSEIGEVLFQQLKQSIQESETDCSS